MTERVTVEVGGMSSGVYHYVRRTAYDVSEAEVERVARRDFELAHGKPSDFGNYGASSETRSVDPADRGQAGHWRRVKKYIDVAGYTTKAGIKKRGHRRRAWVRVWVPERKAVTYYPTAKIDTDKTRDTRGGERRRSRWL